MAQAVISLSWRSRVYWRYPPKRAHGTTMIDEQDKYDGMAARIEAEIADSFDEELEMILL